MGKYLKYLYNKYVYRFFTKKPELIPFSQDIFNPIFKDVISVDKITNTLDIR